MDHWWLLITHYDYARTAVTLQIFGNCATKLLQLILSPPKLDALIAPKSSAQGADECLNFQISRRQPMVRLRPRRTHRALDHIEPAHVAGIGITPLGKVADIPRAPRKARVQEICIQRKNHARILQLVLRLDWLAESHFRAF